MLQTSMVRHEKDRGFSVSHFTKVQIVESVYFCAFSMCLQERETCLHDFIKIIVTLACVQIFTDRFLWNLA